MPREERESWERCTWTTGKSDIGDIGDGSNISIQNDNYE